LIKTHKIKWQQKSEKQQQRSRLRSEKQQRDELNLFSAHKAIEIPTEMSDLQKKKHSLRECFFFSFIYMDYA